ncbi:N-acetyl-gamma-glutamyl-phosphate reductase [Roseospirillum parvum]|uniref:N-acetyl-gamma-glutamyl-phosphate reductase n=1 Tax=Roseospirillum parvum TaxID=83401 RepID=A0A1G7WLD0_9PROT|nr:N-acetyl-gamma-glutamyl-phosphate reductase [Roseospirillum parvum]SDG72030.1 N-acetyl-gamma-glutamyl-phosphate reductase [Roseospirillum parvum]
MSEVRVVILGASGYTGAELVRLLAGHPRVRIVALTADRKAGQPFGAVFPHLAGLDLPDLVTVDQVDWSAADFVFCGLPHGTTQEIIAGLPAHLKICDLSADFRLADPALYADIYGHPHRAVDLQAEAVYGLSELARAAVASARLVANPGCYPTASLLPLMPLLGRGLIDPADITIDAKSGVTGAGRAAKEGSLHAEVSEGFHAYAIASHRHGPEIDQLLSRAAGGVVTAGFTPHLVPMNRGILATTYVRLAEGVDADGLRGALAETYDGSPFVRVLPPGQAPHTRHVRGANLCLIGVFADRRPGRAILVSAIDNLVKGASGQAIQNMNLMLGLPETLGLEQPPLFP